MKGRDKIYLHGSMALKARLDEFYECGHHKISPYHEKYIPNPFRHQYDLFIHLYIDWEDILKEEVSLLRKLARKEKNTSYDDKADELKETNTLYGITKSDAIFAAGELRWPTQIKPNGARIGKFIRDPWAERRIAALNHPDIHYVAGFGGGGQGKTTVFLAYDLMMWDHYLFTEKGARCMISTTNQDKLDSVGWPYIINLNATTQQGISLYAGRGKPGGKYTLRRPDGKTEISVNKDTAGVFKGLLLGETTNRGRIIDKLTGAHGHWYVGYTLDEATTTSEAPLDAASNFTMHAKKWTVKLAGNYDDDSDTLGSNVKPLEGWGSVDETTGQWITKTKNNKDIIVLHFNNNLSPGMDEEGARLFPHMPSKKILEKDYSASERSMSKLRYRRFWVGYRFADLTNDKVLTEEFILINGADKPLIFRQNRIDRNFGSFDSAPAELDRNMLMLGQSGICAQTGQKIFGPTKIKILHKATASLQYYRESSMEILKTVKENGIGSGDLIVDFTGRPGHAEHLHQAGFFVQRLVYNSATPDGVKEDNVTHRIGRKMPLGIQIDFKQGTGPAHTWYAHEVAETKIDFAAWLCRQYIIAGRLKGISHALLEAINSRGMDLEFYSRKWRMKNSQKYAERFKLASKDEFKSDFGFSPDILDCLFELCYFAFVHLQIPLTPVDSNATLVEPSGKKDQIDQLNEINTNYHFDRHESKTLGTHFEAGATSEGSDDYWKRF